MPTHVSSITWIPFALKQCNHAANCSSGPGRALMWPCNVHIKRLHCGTHAADGFAWPKCATQDRKPAIFEFADRTKSIARVGRLIGVQTAPGKFAFERDI